MREFPAGFLWGAATSAHQVEGDDECDWSDWERVPGHIVDGTTSGRACEWWAGRAESDLELARSLGHNAVRLGLSWARLEPEPGVWNDAAFERYLAMLAHARRLGLATLLTLHHFTLPRWAARGGGWKSRGLVARFGRFCAEAAGRLAKHVDLFATLNEPSVLAFMGYAGKRWPPGDGRVSLYGPVLAAQLRAHLAARNAIRAKLPDAVVGIVLNAPAFDPDRQNRRRDRWAAALQDRMMTGAVLNAFRRGRLEFPLALRRQELPDLAHSFDFLGLNYYGRYRVRFDRRAWATMFGRHVQSPSVHTEHVDWGEIHPDGLYRMLMRFAELGKPVYVTENGVFDAGDSVRQRYLVDHVSAVHRAIGSGADVRGYFHWSLIDNFEWAEGYSAPFGLVAVDRETQARSPRESARIYERICRANAV